MVPPGCRVNDPPVNRTAPALVVAPALGTAPCSVNVPVVDCSVTP